MTYTFSCPAPCQKVIVTEACNDDDAVEKLIKAGALICRNKQSCSSCNTIYFVMKALPYEQIREVVRLYMQTGDLPKIESMNL